jgi:hypothetical protein
LRHHAYNLCNNPREPTKEKAEIWEQEEQGKKHNEISQSAMTGVNDEKRHLLIATLVQF